MYNNAPNTIKYAKTHLKRIPFDVQKEYYDEVIKPIADSIGEPVNTFIKKAIAERIERLENDNKIS